MTAAATILVHATCVCWDGGAVLLRGQPGSGKSDLALRLIDAGAMLVADDQVALTVDDGRLLAMPPPVIAGLLEVRGVGLVRLPYRRRADVVLAVDLVPAEQVPRLPEPDEVEVAGVALPRYTLHPFAASAVAKMRLLIRRQWPAGP